MINFKKKLKEFFCNHNWRITNRAWIKLVSRKFLKNDLNDYILLMVEECKKCGKEKSILIEQEHSKRCEVEWAKETIARSNFPQK